MAQALAQDALFDARWLVQSPYVTDNLQDGCWREPRAKAIARRYVQLNSPGLVWCVVIDVDHDDADWAADRADLPEPSWTAINPFNHHAHIAYVLEVPVARSEYARTGPLRFLARIEAGLIDALGGDLAYAGLLTKNPVHRSWATRWCSGDGVYTLAQLATALGDRLPKQLPRKVERSHGLGRNCTLFNELRTWAYTAIRRHRDDGRDAWEGMVLDWATAINSGFPEPLNHSEVKATAHSVAKWVWTHFSETEFSKIQQARAKKPRRLSVDKLMEVDQWVQ